MAADPSVFPADTPGVLRSYAEQLPTVLSVPNLRTTLRDAADEIAALLAAGERDKAERDFYKRQLDAVDATLGPWESELPDGCAVGRVQTILNLKADRERGERDRRQIAQLTEALAVLASESHWAIRRFVDGSRESVWIGPPLGDVLTAARAVLAGAEDAANG